jgi:hypothetical protein
MYLNVLDIKTVIAATTITHASHFRGVPNEPLPVGFTLCSPVVLNEKGG